VVVLPVLLLLLHAVNANRNVKDKAIAKIRLKLFIFFDLLF
jgi:hypothetical protein